MTHPFITNKQISTVQLFGTLPNWKLVTEESGYGGFDSLFGWPYEIGDEIGLVTVKGHIGWSIKGIKKTEVEQFLNTYTLASGYSAPRYVPKP